MPRLTKKMTKRQVSKMKSIHLAWERCRRREGPFKLNLGEGGNVELPVNENGGEKGGRAPWTTSQYYGGMDAEGTHGEECTVHWVAGHMSAIADRIRWRKALNTSVNKNGLCGGQSRLSKCFWLEAWLETSVCWLNGAGRIVLKVRTLSKTKEMK